MKSPFNFSSILSSLIWIKKINFKQYSCPGKLCLKLGSLDWCFFHIGSLFVNHFNLAAISSIMSRFNFVKIFLYFKINLYFDFVIDNCFYFVIETQLSFSFFILILLYFLNFIDNFLNLD
jgi:hypothetical protein